LLAIIDQFYPRSMWPGDVGYRETVEDQRFMRAVREAGTGAAYERWTGMLDRLRESCKGRIINTSLHLAAASRGPCYEGVCSLLKTEEAQHNVDFCVSLLAPYYLVYGWRYFQEGRRFEVRFDLDEEEQMYGRKIAEEIESTYGYEPMPPDVGSVLVADIELEGVRYHYVGHGTINDYLFTINW
jgi:hypothetical protein